MSPLATVAGKSFNGKLTAKIDFSLEYFILPFLMLTLELYKILTFWQKMVNYFQQSVDIILKDVFVTETIVLC